MRLQWLSLYRIRKKTIQLATTVWTQIQKWAQSPILSFWVPGRVRDNVRNKSMKFAPFLFLLRLPVHVGAQFVLKAQGGLGLAPLTSEIEFKADATAPNTYIYIYIRSQFRLKLRALLSGIGVSFDSFGAINGCNDLCFFVLSFDFLQKMILSNFLSQKQSVMWEWFNKNEHSAAEGDESYPTNH